MTSSLAAEDSRFATDPNLDKATRIGERAAIVASRATAHHVGPRAATVTTASKRRLPVCEFASDRM